ncbi:MAG: T9SS type A sorting domain-containing protein [bacterium]
MKRLLLILTLAVMLSASIINGDEFQIKQILNVGTGHPVSYDVLTKLNYYNNRSLLIINYYVNRIQSDFYEYNGFSNSFEKCNTLDSGWVYDDGDFDLDGKIDYLGSTLYDTSSVAVQEQSDTNMINNIWTWTSGHVFENGLYALSSTNLFKTDGRDRFYGSPNPYQEYGEPYGWFYAESDSDNSYHVEYVSDNGGDFRIVYTMDVGYVDDDSLLDVVAGTNMGATIWESKDSDNDTFTNIVDPDSYRGGGLIKIMNDIDKDNLNEFMTAGKAYDQSPAEWLFGICETKSNDLYDTIWSHWIRKDYGPVGASFDGCGGDYGDIDGDGQDELVLCAGSIIEVFEVAEDDSFEMIWSMDNDTFSGSLVLVYDFTGNGRAEIIWTGQSDPQLPLTYDMEVMKTYIIEWDTLYDENKPTLDSAVAYEGTVVGDGIDEDDIVGLYFNRSMDTCTVNRGNIDEVLKLSNSHTWLDGTDSLGAVWWNTARDRMFIKFKTNTENPTIAVGDTISPDSITINGSEPYRYPCYNEVILRGDFGPEGTGESREIKDVAELQSIRVTGCKTIEWNANTEATLTVYDISGRELIKEESKTTGEHKTDIRHLKNGIYFIKLKTMAKSYTVKYLKLI